MTQNTKDEIVKATQKLLFEKHKKKITVKDIVEECGITRQAFYYHFEDMMELFRFMIEKKLDGLLKEALSATDPEEGIRVFLIMAVNFIPYAKKGKNSNYGDELGQLIYKYVQCFLNTVIEAKRLYRSCNRAEVDFIVRYHSKAIIGILEEWTDEDTKNMDQIIHLVSQLMSNGISI